MTATQPRIRFYRCPICGEEDMAIKVRLPDAGQTGAFSLCRCFASKIRFDGEDQLRDPHESLVEAVRAFGDGYGPVLLEGQSEPCEWLNDVFAAYPDFTRPPAGAHGIRREVEVAAFDKAAEVAQLELVEAETDEEEVGAEEDSSLDPAMFRPEDEIERAKFEAALAYIERGYAIVLLHGTTGKTCACRGAALCPNPGKHPVGKNWTERAIRSRDALSKRWYARSARPTNIGTLLTNEQRLLLIDEDNKNGKAGAKTLREWEQKLEISFDDHVIQSTPSGGKHYVFRVPSDFPIERLPNGAVAQGVDVLRNGRQFVLSPSETPKGRYGLEGQGPVVLPALTEVPEAPQALLEHLATLASRSRCRGTQDRLSEADLAELQAPSVEMVREAVKHIPNDWQFRSREKWVGMAYRIRTACGRGNEAAAREIFVEFSERWVGGDVRPGEAERVFDTLNRDQGSGGWPTLLRIAIQHGFEVAEEVANAAALVEAQLEFQADPNAVPTPVRSGLYVRPFSEVETVPIEWLLKGRLARREITMINGWPGEGKTTVVIDIVARLTTREELMDHTKAPHRLKVLFLSTEDNASVLKLRLQAAGADLKRVLTMEDAALEGMRLPSGRAKWKEVIRDQKIDVVVVDPMMAFLDGALKSIAEQDARRFMQALREVVLETEAAAICIRHPNKATAGGNMNAVSAASGSLAFTAAARIEMLVGRLPDSEDVRALVSVKNNLAMHPPALVYQIRSSAIDLWGDGEMTQDVAAVEWLRVDDSVTSEELLTRRESREVRCRLAEAKEFLENVLANGPADRNDVLAAARRVGIQQRTLERARAEIGWSKTHGNLRYGGCQVWGLNGQSLEDFTPAAARQHGADTADSPQESGEESATENDAVEPWTEEDEASLRDVIE